MSGLRLNLLVTLKCCLISSVNRIIDTKCLPSMLKRFCIQYVCIQGQVRTCEHNAQIFALCTDITDGKRPQGGGGARQTANAVCNAMKLNLTPPPGSTGSTKPATPKDMFLQKKYPGHGVVCEKNHIRARMCMEMIPSIDQPNSRIRYLQKAYPLAQLAKDTISLWPTWHTDSVHLRKGLAALFSL